MKCAPQLFVIGVCAFLLTSLMPAAAHAASVPPLTGATRLLVGFVDTTTAGDRARIVNQAGGVVRRDIGALDTTVVLVPPGGDADRVARSLAAHDAVTAIERDAVAATFDDPQTDADPGPVPVPPIVAAVLDLPPIVNDLLGLLPAVVGILPPVTGPDPLAPQQWGLRATRAQEAWAITRATPGQVVAVIDSGVDYNHLDLAGKVIKGYDWVDEDADPADPVLNFSHGTHVAGIIAADTDNGLGVASVAPNARILAIRVLGADNRGYHSDIASGIVEAADKGAQVINLSLGGSASSTTLRDAVAYAAGKGVFLACATGNEAAHAIAYPAAYPGCFAVGATTSRDERASFSNTGPEIDLVAPGDGILGLAPPQLYASANGTSMATPFVAGAAALLSSRGSGPLEIASRLRASAIDLGPVGWDAATGSGRLDIAAALGTPSTPAAPVPVDWQDPTGELRPAGPGATPGTSPDDVPADSVPGIGSPGAGDDARVAARMKLAAVAGARQAARRCGTSVRTACPARRNRPTVLAGAVSSSRVIVRGVVRVQLYELRRGRWRVDHATTLRTSATGSFRLDVRLRRGTWRIRSVAIQSATHRASNAASVYVRVP